MYRKHMTPAENERRKREHSKCLYSNTRKLADSFPDIERIEISYVNHHKCIFSNSIKNNVLKYTPQSNDFFVIDCLNPECSSFGFDLKNDIYSMQREHLTEFSGERDCDGQEAPDHPEQKCSGTLNYTIRIIYK